MIDPNRKQEDRAVTRDKLQAGSYLLAAVVALLLTAQFI